MAGKPLNCSVGIIRFPPPLKFPAMDEFSRRGRGNASPPYHAFRRHSLIYCLIHYQRHLCTDAQSFRFVTSTKYAPRWPPVFASVNQLCSNACPLFSSSSKVTDVSLDWMFFEAS